MAQAMIMRRGGGGSRVGALAVTAVANYASLPATPTLYQMCIVSATAVNDVYVTNAAPASPVAGDVQILVSASSVQPVPADKNGAVMLYPVNAYQYTGSAWVLRDLYTWTGTAWVVPARYLLQAGEDKTSFGGAIVTTPGINLIQQTGYKQFMNGELRKPNAIDVTPYRRLCLHAKSDYSGGKGYLRLSIAGANAQEVVLGPNEGVYSIDLSAQSGLRYVGCSTTNVATYLYDWWLE